PVATPLVRLGQGGPRAEATVPEAGNPVSGAPAVGRVQTPMGAPPERARPVESTEETREGGARYERAPTALRAPAVDETSVLSRTAAVDATVIAVPRPRTAGPDAASRVDSVTRTRTTARIRKLGARAALIGLIGIIVLVTAIIHWRSQSPPPLPAQSF